MFRIGVLGVILAVVFLGSVYTWTRGVGAGAGTSQPESDPGSSPLQVVLGAPPMGRHNVGQVPRGGRIEIPFVVSNRGSATVQIGPIQTSCDCLSVVLDTSRVSAGTEINGRAIIDLAGEAEFVGGLMLDAEAAADGRPVFALKLAVDVK